MKIRNIEGLSARDLQREVNKGSRFIYYVFTVSLLFITFKRNSDVYLVRINEKTMFKALPYTMISALLGWWGIPYGPRVTLDSIRTNLRGGKDVTDDVMATVAGYMLYEETQRKT
ncbi:MAG TPA: hypothetical protein VFX58_15475 [Chitinophagaceae bacterium]|nr:hypothetical protein [Chitinophagaceae bacterium]